MSSYGCFYRLLRENDRPAKSYLPQVRLDIHAHVLSSNTRTTITQTYINPSNTESIPELFYSFPLYDGASIVGFTCRVGNEVIRGQVKPKKKAEEVYQEAKSKGQTAAIFDQSYDTADVFKTRLGNVPAGGKVHIDIILVQESKQDVQTDGIRYTVPIAIAPRYGTQNDDQAPSAPEGIAVKTAIKVDLVMEKDSDIRNIRSPTHPIEVTIGRTSTMPETTSKACYASVKLRENVIIQEDFVVTVGSSKKDLPFAFLETHPVLPNQRALMVSLIPKFGLPQSASEIIFVIDRSGSMEDKIPTLRLALEVFLKSLPIGIHFNIVSFGCRSKSLWPRSKICDRENLEEALKYTKKIKADMDKVPEVLLLTDGEVWDQNAVFEFVGKAVKESSARFFTLGIGNAVSHSLIGGISRAGMGFSQSVQNYEELNKTVVRMLKGALMARLTDATLDINLPDLEGEDFMVVEPIEEDLKDGQAEGTNKPIKLFDDKYEESDKVENVHQPLPKVTAPSIIQAPVELPPLFPFIRSTVYILFSGDVSSFPETIKLRARSDHGPLELDIPVQDIGLGETIHQLAAKRAMSELEEGHGWIHTTKDVHGDLITSKWESQIEELVQNECERLGVRFQIAGKHCSFVAVQDSHQSEDKGAARVSSGAMAGDEDAELVDCLEISDFDMCDAGQPLAASASLAVCLSSPAYCPEGESDEDMGFGLFGGSSEDEMAEEEDSVPRPAKKKKKMRRKAVGQFFEEEAGIDEDEEEILNSHPKDDSSGLHALISMQTFDGYWDWNNQLLQALGLEAESAKAKLQTRYKDLAGNNSDIWGLPVWKEVLATCLVGHFLQTQLSDSKDVWELLKEKADTWVQKSLNDLNETDRKTLRELIDEVGIYF
ncbi:hypothetical protein N7509_001775 [Penicillium cosmopolitanum]|uniref:VIT domain-containing protein n=1 Tax=Penicillium cosmopolitanum TaxID=1131564 RepID=A0A9X0BCN7_9EURO|nr:uncharacterized protein N7509_001775 [Penicillium cosmopolitanum]KAJ5407892.1 hypothetical protein N7509_001775 [Penicillium cosmopolitanum]